MSKPMLGCIAGLSLAAFGQVGLNIAPIPADPLELVNGGIQSADSAASRDAALQLLARARANFALQTAGQGYHLKSRFVVTSHGQTNFDGAWEMEDQFSPGLGLRFTAKAANAFSTTHLAGRGKSFSESTSSYVPLRLQEARAALFGPMAKEDAIKRDSIRTAAGIYNGRAVTCVLLGSPINGAPPLARRWEETEECVDPQSGLLQTHSQAAGRYYAYEYSNDLQIAGHPVPKKITVTEAGEVVSEIEVESLAMIQKSEASQFEPTQEMRQRGRAVGIAGAIKVSHVYANVPVTRGALVRPVVIFGVITPAGQLVEAHSLQPSDPNSAAALDNARKMSFSPMPSPPEQRFVFIFEKFVVPQ